MSWNVLFLLPQSDLPNVRPIRFVRQHLGIKWLSITTTIGEKHYLFPVQSLSKFSTPSSTSTTGQTWQHINRMESRRLLVRKTDEAAKNGIFRYQMQHGMSFCTAEEGEEKEAETQNVSGGLCKSVCNRQLLHIPQAFTKWPSFQNHPAAITPSLSSCNSACKTHLNL